MANKSCPLCQKPLSLHQVNVNLAVFICDDMKCKYPIGYDCIVIERKLEDMGKSVEVLSENKCDLDDWVEDVDTDIGKTTSNLNIAVEMPSLEPSEQNTEWIDNLVEDAVNKVRNEPPGDESHQTDYDDILNFIDF